MKKQVVLFTGKPSKSGLAIFTEVGVICIAT